ncbi:peptidase inhibitor family I36 protein [Streptomyces sp. NPDC048606]|uniref:peptidase inhibitor family I36 protein n=1 Tax=Streptomyces sp. NPDC048606 TaxID=3154726 RepID=UPI00341CB3BE
MPEPVPSGRPPTGRRPGPPRPGRAAAALAAAACLALTPAPAAPAAPAPAPAGGCPPGWMCGWTGPDFTGVASLVAEDFPRYPETTAYVGFNDGASVWNGAGTRSRDGRLQARCVTVYNSTEYRGRSLVLRPDQGVARLPASFGNVRSNRFHPCPPP